MVKCDDDDDVERCRHAYTHTGTEENRTNKNVPIANETCSGSFHLLLVKMKITRTNKIENKIKKKRNKRKRNGANWNPGDWFEWHKWMSKASSVLCFFILLISFFSRISSTSVLTSRPQKQTDNRKCKETNETIQKKETIHEIKLFKISARFTNWWIPHVSHRSFRFLFASASYLPFFGRF